MVRQVCTALVCGVFLLITGAPAAAADEAQPVDKPRVVKPATEAKVKKAAAKKPAAASKREQASAVGYGPNGGAHGPSEEPWQARPNPVDAKKAVQAPEPLRDPVRGAGQAPGR